MYVEGKTQLLYDGLDGDIFKVLGERRRQIKILNEVVRKDVI